MLLKIYPENPSKKEIDTVVQCLRSGGIIIYPTDTVYGLGCDITNHKAIERICALKGIKPDKANFSFVCYDLSNLSEYTKQIDTVVFRILKKSLPGPYTFIFPASHQVPKLLMNTRKKTVGIRVPDHSVAREIVRQLGNPIVSTSIHDEDEIIEYSTDPELIYEKYKDKIDIVIDSGYGGNEASTVIDCSDTELKILRPGKGLAFIEEML